MKRTGASLVEIIVAFSVFVFILVVFFLSLGVQIRSERRAVYCSRANSLAKAALVKAKELTVGQTGQDIQLFEGLQFKVEYASQALPGPAEARFRQLRAKVQVSRPPDPAVIYEATQSQRVADLPL